MSGQNKAQRNRRHSEGGILKVKQNENVEETIVVEKVRRSRVSFGRMVTVQKFEKDSAKLSHGDQVKQKINETAGSDGTLSPNRSRHIAGSSAESNNTTAQMFSDTMNNTASMFQKSMNVLHIESIENIAPHLTDESGNQKDVHCHLHVVNRTLNSTSEMDMDITVTAGTVKEVIAPVADIGLDSTMTMFDNNAVVKSNATITYPDEPMDMSQLNSTSLNNTMDMFTAPGRQSRSTRRLSAIKPPAREPKNINSTITHSEEPMDMSQLNSTSLNNTMDMFSAPRKTVKASRRLSEIKPSGKETAKTNTTITYPDDPMEVSQLNSTALNNTMDMFSTTARPARNNRRSSVLKSPARAASNATLLDNTLAMFDSTAVPDDINADNTVFGGNMSATMLESTISQDDTMNMFPTATSQQYTPEPIPEIIKQDERRKSAPKTPTSAKKMVQNTTENSMLLSNLHEKINSSRTQPLDNSVIDLTNDVDEVLNVRSERSLISMSTCKSPAVKSNNTPRFNTTEGERPSQSFRIGAESILAENDRRNMSISYLNESGLGELRSIYAKDGATLSETLNASTMSTMSGRGGKQRRRSNLVAQLDTSIRSEPRDVTKKNFDLNTSNNGDTNSHSAETLMKIQRLLQFDPRSVSVAVVEPVYSQKFANVARKRLTEDLQSALTTSLNTNKKIVQEEINQIIKNHRKSAVSKMKLSDLDVVDRDTALACRRAAEASWWNDRNRAVSGHLEKAMGSNANLEDQLEKLDDDLYLVENSSSIIKDASLLQQALYDADCLFNFVNPEDIDKMITEEKEKLNAKPALDLPELHQTILRDCGINVQEYEEAVFGEDDEAYLKKYQVMNPLFDEQDKLNNDFNKFEKKQEAWDLAVRRKNNKREEKRRDLDAVIMDVEDQLAALREEFVDVTCH